jgi:2-hydroxy-3-keto-5-methylthiopentenyl-1-phosphate phosphatase
MPRKTRRVGKKKKYHKRTYTKKTRKYKILKGGLGSNDYENIGITDTFIFQSECKQPGGGGDHSSRENKIKEFEKYVFGSEKHVALWKEILVLCREKEIPFYILTSGSKVGIIRTLQLLELSQYVTEVLCNSKIPEINPDNLKDTTRNDFKDMNKYQIIERVINSYCKRDGYKGIFLDNDPMNRENKELCSKVEFILAEGKKINHETERNRILSFVRDLSCMSGPHNSFVSMTRQLYEITRTNLVNLDILQHIHDAIKSGTINVFISDFDGTMSPWRGILPFHFPEFTLEFMSYFNVIFTS